jgi:hypothetical protein
MRFMVLVPGDSGSEAGEMPSTELLEAMTRYNEELVKAGVMIGGDGLQPTSQGARIRFDGKERTVTDGPFAESKEWLGGFWIIEAPDLDAALKWATEGSSACRGKVEVRPFQAE